MVGRLYASEIERDKFAKDMRELSEMCLDISNRMKNTHCDVEEKEKFIFDTMKEIGSKWRRTKKFYEELVL